MGRPEIRDFGGGVYHKEDQWLTPVRETLLFKRSLPAIEKSKGPEKELEDWTKKIADRRKKKEEEGEERR